MLPSELDPFTLNQIFADAVPLDANVDVGGGGLPEEQVSVFKYTNESNSPVIYDITSNAEFVGRIELYNNLEFIKCNFQSVSGAAYLGDTDLYTVDVEYFNNLYNSFYPSAPTVVEELANTSVTIENVDDVKFSAVIQPGGTAYWLMFNSLVDFNISTNVTTLEEPVVEVIPSEPTTTEPQFGETVSVRGEGEFNFNVPESIINSIQDSPTNFSVYGTTDKVVQITIKYGSVTTTTGYIYDPEYVTDLEAIKQEIISATGNENVVLTPAQGANLQGGVVTNQDGLRNLLDLNILPVAGAVLEVVVNAPIPGTVFKVQTQAAAATGEPFVYDDPQAFRARPNESGSSVRQRLRHLGYF
jgi:hypothetical protein